MTGRIQIHLKVEEGRSPLKEWTFDHPKKITLGYSPSASLRLFSSTAGSEITLFERAGDEIRMRAHPNITSFLNIDDKQVSLASLKEAGALKSDRKGDYVLLKTKTIGDIELGDAKIRFWVTPSSSNWTEYPSYPKFLSLLKEAPLLFMFLFLLFGILEFSLIRYMRSLPISEVTLQEVNNRFARIEIPDSDYVRREVMRREAMNSNASNNTSPQKPEAQKTQSSSKPRPTAATAGGGFLSAVANGSGGSKGSPFSDLFTSSALNSEVDKALKAGHVDEVISNRLKNPSIASAGPLGTAPETIGIGNIARQGTTDIALAKEIAGPAVPRMTVETTSGGSGDVDQKGLEELVASRAGELRDCYERALLRNPKLSGKIIMRLLLKANQGPILSSDPKSTLNDASLSQCMITKMSAWPFERPSKDTGPILLPFIFSPASKG